ncbi:MULTISPECIES: OmpA family protein [unclassified Spirosoma]|uniref:OmpA family protein n=1 Tax=unclassified Spirosoma TaxID=2621999 RepID=UPI000967CA2A|nr:MULTISPECIES: OmpA family protein [unclassified Spirosoma]MBN8825021.1 OmpA family protein [Spirosoma sp.]OJW73315.1 MAG: flagellar motor protein MotB [Spirosoma sp. 48-14]
MNAHGIIVAAFFSVAGHLYGQAKKDSTVLANPAVENLGNQVNSEYNEINPVISPDGKTLYFARISHPNNTHGTKGSQDIWFSDLDAVSGKWGPARRMGFPLNKDEYNCAYSITPDGNTMLIKGQYNNGNYETRGFSISKKTATGWSPPQKIDIPGYVGMSKGQFDCGFMSADGKTLVMAFSEKKNSKEDDIYVSFRQKDGSWTKPMDLGSEVNTKFTETTPFLAPDGATLYFSSNRDGGLGSNDIYVTKRVDKTWKHWTKPVNLGPKVNTDGYDAYYTLSASGDYAYLTTFKNTVGKGDIVRVKLTEDRPTNQPSRLGSGDEVAGQTDATRPDPVALISGKVVDQITGKPIEARIVYQTLPDGAEVGEATSDPLTGEYKIVLPYGQKFSVRAIAKDFISESINIDLTQAKGFQEIKSDPVKMAPIKEGSVIRLNNIFFDTGKTELRPESGPELDRLVTTLNENPKMTIEVRGHTDNTGSNEINNKLSQDRADAVREYFISKGIEPDRVGSKGFGESKPIATNDTEAGRQQNRRVEFAIVKK